MRCYETPGGQRRYMAVVEDRSMEEERDLAQMQIGAMMDTAGVGLATFQESTGWLRQRAGRAAVRGRRALPSAALQAVGRDIVVADSLPEFEKVQHALRHTLRTEARYAIRHPELGLRWLLTRVEPATLASGKRTTSVVTLDITEQHQTQQRSEQLLHELTTILESTSAGIAYLRANVLVRCNQRFEGMLGLAAGSAAGSSLQELFAQRPQASRIVEQTLGGAGRRGRCSRPSSWSTHGCRRTRQRVGTRCRCAAPGRPRTRSRRSPCCRTSRGSRRSSASSRSWRAIVS